MRAVTAFLRLATLIVLIALHKASRRVEWFFLRRIILRRKRLALLVQAFVVREFLPSEYFKKVTLALYYRPGYGLGESSDIAKTLFWEAPLAIAVWSKDGPVAGMAVEFRRNALCIRQLQGVSGASFPPECRDWPKRFVRACTSLARQAGIKHVRLYRADQSLFYFFPDAAASEGQSPSEALENHRARMRRRYDGTARQLRMHMTERWGEWSHPTAQ